MGVRNLFLFYASWKILSPKMIKIIKATVKMIMGKKFL